VPLIKFALRKAFRFNGTMMLESSVTLRPDPMEHAPEQFGSVELPSVAGLPNLLGSCGKPCDGCNEPCAERQERMTGRLAQWLKESLFNTLDVCFDDVYQEPKTILIVGGCRQMDLSQHLALLLPAAEITLVDPDEAVVAKAKEEVCCRFKFVTGQLEALPFEREAFDLTIAHNFFAYPQNWQAALEELGRVTNGNLFISLHRPLLWKLVRRFGLFARAMASLGLVLPERLPGSFEFMSDLYRFAKVKTKLAPFPWTTYMTVIRPRWEEKLVLADS
jgi:SAM-dependent methyltransferase